MIGALPILLPALVALTIAGSLGLLAFFAGRSRPASGPDLHSAVFRYRFLPRVFTSLSAIFLPAAITFAVLFFPAVRKEPLAYTGGFLIVAGLFLPLAWESAWYFVALDDHGVTHRSGRRGLRHFRWDDIAGVSYSSFNMWFVVRFEGGRKIRVPILVDSLKEFLRRIEEHLPIDGMREARVGYEKVGRPFPVMVNDPILEARPPR